MPLMVCHSHIILYCALRMMYSGFIDGTAFQMYVSSVLCLHSQSTFPSCRSVWPAQWSCIVSNASPKNIVMMNPSETLQFTLRTFIFIMVMMMMMMMMMMMTKTTVTVTMVI